MAMLSGSCPGAGTRIQESMANFPKCFSPRKYVSRSPEALATLHLGYKWQMSGESHDMNTSFWLRCSINDMKTNSFDVLASVPDVKMIVFKAFGTVQACDWRSLASRPS